MKVLFVGSLDENSADFTTVKENLKALIHRLAQSNSSFLARAVRRAPGTALPIDTVVLDALSEYNLQYKEEPADLILFIEPGVEYQTPDISHKTHFATTPLRTAFYRELLELVDFVVGVGGSSGLLRFLMVAEWVGKPFHILPGSGGAADTLWQDYFKENIQLTTLPKECLMDLKRTPYANRKQATYGREVSKLLTKLNQELRTKLSTRDLIKTPDNITLSDSIASAKSFSLGLWIVIMSLAMALFSFGYFLASHISP